MRWLIATTLLLHAATASKIGMNLPCNKELDGLLASDPDGNPQAFLSCQGVGVGTIGFWERKVCPNDLIFDFINQMCKPKAKKARKQQAISIAILNNSCANGETCIGGTVCDMDTLKCLCPYGTIPQLDTLSCIKSQQFPFSSFGGYERAPNPQPSTDSTFFKPNPSFSQFMNNNNNNNNNNGYGNPATQASSTPWMPSSIFGGSSGEFQPNPNQKFVFPNFFTTTTTPAPQKKIPVLAQPGHSCRSNEVCTGGSICTLPIGLCLCPGELEARDGECVLPASASIKITKVGIGALCSELAECDHSSSCVMGRCACVSPLIQHDGKCVLKQERIEVGPGELCDNGEVCIKGSICDHVIPVCVCPADTDLSDGECRKMGEARPQPPQLLPSTRAPGNYVPPQPQYVTPPPTPARTQRPQTLPPQTPPPTMPPRPQPPIVPVLPASSFTHAPATQGYQPRPMANAPVKQPTFNFNNFQTAQTQKPNHMKISLGGSKQAGVGVRCSLNTDCMIGAYCNGNTNPPSCQCLSTHVNVEGRCEKVVYPGQVGCRSDLQCAAAYTGTQCIDRVCVCPEGNRAVDQTCIPELAHPGEPCGISTNIPACTRGSVCHTGVCRCIPPLRELNGVCRLTSTNDTPMHDVTNIPKSTVPSEVTSYMNANQPNHPSECYPTCMQPFECKNAVCICPRGIICHPTFTNTLGKLRSKRQINTGLVCWPGSTACSAGDGICMDGICHCLNGMQPRNGACRTVSPGGVGTGSRAPTSCSQDSECGTDGAVCLGGRCQCSNGAELKNGVCVSSSPSAKTDMNESASSIGAYKNINSPCHGEDRCSGGSKCVQHVCQCTDGSIETMGRCHQNPGGRCSSGQNCNGGSVCSLGICRCPDGQVVAGTGTETKCLLPPARPGQSCQMGERCLHGSVCRFGTCMCTAKTISISGKCVKRDAMHKEKIKEKPLPTDTTPASLPMTNTQPGRARPPGSSCVANDLCSGGSRCSSGVCICDEFEVIISDQCVGSEHEASAVIKAMRQPTAAPGQSCNVRTNCTGGSLCIDRMCQCEAGEAFDSTSGTCAPNSGVEPPEDATRPMEATTVIPYSAPSKKSAMEQPVPGSHCRLTMDCPYRTECNGGICRCRTGETIVADTCRPSVHEVTPGGKCDPRKGYDCVGESRCIYGVCTCTRGLFSNGKQCVTPEQMRMVPPGKMCAMDAGQMCSGGARCLDGFCQCAEDEVPDINDKCVKRTSVYPVYGKTPMVPDNGLQTISGSTGSGFMIPSTPPTSVPTVSPVTNQYIPGLGDPCNLYCSQGLCIDNVCVKEDDEFKGKIDEIDALEKQMKASGKGVMVDIAPNTGQDEQLLYGHRCQSNQDCPANTICSGGSCFCKEGYRATAGYCEAVVPIGGACMSTNQCQPMAFCLQGHCVCNSRDGRNCGKPVLARPGEPCSGSAEKSETGVICSYNSYCGIMSMVCECPSGMSTTEGRCEATAEKSGQACVTSRNCHKFSYCDNGYCLCKTGFELVGGHCIPPANRLTLSELVSPGSSNQIHEFEAPDRRPVDHRNDGPQSPMQERIRTESFMKMNPAGRLPMQTQPPQRQPTSDQGEELDLMFMPSSTISSISTTGLPIDLMKPPFNYPSMPSYKIVKPSNQPNLPVLNNPAGFGSQPGNNNFNNGPTFPYNNFNGNIQSGAPQPNFINSGPESTMYSPPNNFNFSPFFPFVSKGSVIQSGDRSLPVGSKSAPVSGVQSGAGPLPKLRIAMPGEYCGDGALCLGNSICAGKFCRCESGSAAENGICALRKGHRHPGRRLGKHNDHAGNPLNSAENSGEERQFAGPLENCQNFEYCTGGSECSNINGMGLICQCPLNRILLDEECVDTPRNVDLAGVGESCSSDGSASLCLGGSSCASSGVCICADGRREILGICVMTAQAGDDCGSGEICVDGSVCVATGAERTCVCPPGRVSKKGRCVDGDSGQAAAPVNQLGASSPAEGCDSHSVCMDNSICNGEGICQCLPKFKELQNRCIPESMVRSIGEECPPGTLCSGGSRCMGGYCSCSREQLAVEDKCVSVSPRVARKQARDIESRTNCKIDADCSEHFRCADNLCVCDGTTAECLFLLKDYLETQETTQSVLLKFCDSGADCPRNAECDANRCVCRDGFTLNHGKADFEGDWVCEDRTSRRRVAGVSTVTLEPEPESGTDSVEDPNTAASTTMEFFRATKSTSQEWSQEVGSQTEITIVSTEDPEEQTTLSPIRPDRLEPGAYCGTSTGNENLRCEHGAICFKDYCVCSYEDLPLDGLCVPRDGLVRIGWRCSRTQRCAPGYSCLLGKCACDIGSAACNPNEPVTSPPGGSCTEARECTGGSVCREGWCICPDPSMIVQRGICIQSGNRPTLPPKTVPLYTTGAPPVYQQAQTTYHQTPQTQQTQPQQVQTFNALPSPSQPRKKIAPGLQCGPLDICVGGSTCVEGMCLCPAGTESNRQGRCEVITTATATAQPPTMIQSYRPTPAEFTYQWRTSSTRRPIEFIELPTHAPPVITLPPATPTRQQATPTYVPETPQTTRTFTHSVTTVHEAQNECEAIGLFCRGNTICVNRSCQCPKGYILHHDGCVPPDEAAKRKIRGKHRHQQAAAPVAAVSQYAKPGEDCGDGQICIGGSVCNDEWECTCPPEKPLVQNEQCQPEQKKSPKYAGPGESCDEYTNCTNNSTCHSGQCRCPPQFIAVSGYCVELPMPSTPEMKTVKLAKPLESCGNGEQCDGGSSCDEDTEICMCPPGQIVFGVQCRPPPSQTTRAETTQKMTTPAVTQAQKVVNRPTTDCFDDSNCGDGKVCLAGRCRCRPGTVDNAGVCESLEEIDAGERPVPISYAKHRVFSSDTMKPEPAVAQQFSRHSPTAAYVPEEVVTTTLAPTTPRPTTTPAPITTEAVPEPIQRQETQRPRITGPPIRRPKPKKNNSGGGSGGSGGSPPGKYKTGGSGNGNCPPGNDPTRDDSDRLIMCNGLEPNCPPRSYCYITSGGFATEEYNCSLRPRMLKYGQPCDDLRDRCTNGAKCLDSVCKCAMGYALSPNGWCERFEFKIPVKSTPRPIMVQPVTESSYLAPVAPVKPVIQNVIWNQTEPTTRRPTWFERPAFPTPAAFPPQSFIQLPTTMRPRPPPPQTPPTLLPPVPVEVIPVHRPAPVEPPKPRIRGRPAGATCRESDICLFGSSCLEGRCECPAHLLKKDGHCVKPKKKNLASPGDSCSNGEQCTGGSVCDFDSERCICAGGHQVLNGVCKGKGSQHFVAAGSRCDSGETCSGGSKCENGICECDQLHYEEDGYCRHQASRSSAIGHDLGGPLRFRSQTAQQRPLATVCNPNTCRLPDCFCSISGREPPLSVPLYDIPQFVVLTFDDAINGRTLPDYLSLFQQVKYRNPNGCPVKGTFFVSHEWTNYDAVQWLYDQGMELASNSIAHINLAGENSSRWLNEMDGQRRIMAKFGNVLEEEIIGMRAPQLAAGGDAQFEMMKRAGFVWDNTLSANPGIHGEPYWPQTLDHTPAWNCHEENCPESSFPGLWEIPLNQFYGEYLPQIDSYRRASMIRAAVDLNATVEELTEMLHANFDRSYTGNKAPVVLSLNADFLQLNGKNTGMKALNRFLEEILFNKDVFVVTMKQLVEWLREPLPMTQIHNSSALKCSRSSFSQLSPSAEPALSGPSSCAKPNKCMYRTPGMNSQEHQFLTCSPCPQLYPWLDNPIGNTPE